MRGRSARRSSQPRVGTRVGTAVFLLHADDDQVLQNSAPPLSYAIDARAFSFGLMVRDLTSPPLGKARAPDWSFEMVGKEAESGSENALSSASLYATSTAEAVARGGID